MALENYLIVLKDGVPPQTTDKLVSAIKSLNGKVELTTNEGKVIIATFDNSFINQVRQLPYVKLVGGVTVNRQRS